MRKRGWGWGWGQGLLLLGRKGKGMLPVVAGTFQKTAIRGKSVEERGEMGCQKGLGDREGMKDRVGRGKG